MLKKVLEICKNDDNLLIEKLEQELKEIVIR